MSNVYLDNNRIMKMKDVDKKLKKIGTWRLLSTKDLLQRNKQNNNLNQNYNVIWPQIRPIGILYITHILTDYC